MAGWTGVGRDGISWDGSLRADYFLSGGNSKLNEITVNETINFADGDKIISGDVLGRNIMQITTDDFDVFSTNIDLNPSNEFSLETNTATITGTDNTTIVGNSSVLTLDATGFLFTGDISAEDDIIPVSASIQSLGTSGDSWYTAYLAYIYTSGITLSGNIIPTANDSYDLGSGSYKFNEIWGTYGTFGNYATSNLSSYLYSAGSTTTTSTYNGNLIVLDWEGTSTNTGNMNAVQVNFRNRPTGGNGGGTVTEANSLRALFSPNFTANNAITEGNCIKANLNCSTSYTGTITSFSLFRGVDDVDAIAITTMYGLYLGDLTNGTTNYAIYTNLGDVRFGDSVTLGAASSDVVNFIAGSGATAPSTTAGCTTTNRYGGDTNFLGDPNAWLSIQSNGTTYKVPLYT